MKNPMSNKTPEMRNAIEEMFPGTKENIAARRCPLCKDVITGFRDALSKREYEISGMCQNCQDEVFK
jgi:hypothetical protein